MNQTAQTALFSFVGAASARGTLHATKYLHHRFFGRAQGLTNLVAREYQARLGDAAGARRARQVGRLLARRGYSPDYFTAEQFFFDTRDRFWCAAEAVAAVHALRLPKDPAVEQEWLVAFAGPNRDGAPLTRFVDLTLHPNRWDQWVQEVGGPDLVLSAIRAGLTPQEITDGVRSGTLTPDTAAVLAALH